MLPGPTRAPRHAGVRKLAILAAAALCAGAAACAGRASGAYAQTEWSMEGVIAAVEPGPGEVRLSVDAVPAGAQGPERVVLVVSSATEVTVQAVDGTTRAGQRTDLVAGVRIRARHDGAEMRSLPPQYRATHVRVLPPRA